jgi:hypothetical protein
MVEWKQSGLTGMNTIIRIVTVIAFITCASLVWAQQVIGVRAGLISYMEGVVYVGTPMQCDGNSECELKNGQLLQTGDGVVEVQLGPAASLWMAENGKLYMENNDLTDTRVRIEEGSIFIEIIDTGIDQNINLRLRDAVITIRGPGRYRLDSETSLLRVFDGRADVVQGSQKVSARRGRAATITDAVNVSRFSAADAAADDDFHAWVAERSEVLYAAIKMMSIGDVRRKSWEMQRMFHDPGYLEWYY